MGEAVRVFVRSPESRCGLSGGNLFGDRPVVETSSNQGFVENKA